MQVFKLLLSSILLLVTGFSATAQKDGLDKEHWLKANFYDKNDAVDFIRTAYEQFTPVIGKRKTETGIYKRIVKIKDCELIIETQSRVQESAWKADHEYDKNLVVIELDMVTLDGNDLKPSDPKGLFGGPNFSRTHKITSYSILEPVINKDDSKFSRLHYEEHLQWAYQYLIDQCKK